MSVETTVLSPSIIKSMDFVTFLWFEDTSYKHNNIMLVLRTVILYRTQKGYAEILCPKILSLQLDFEACLVQTVWIEFLT